MISDPRANQQFDRSIHTEGGPPAATRVERDALGEVEIPAEAYWGINVARALENFAISGRPISIYPDLIFGYACVKQAAARANLALGVLDARRAELIDRACEDIKGGALMDQFVVDVLQGGAGTSTNMNLNEVIANRGLELAGLPRATYSELDPNDHVNRSQSTNDTYPTALKIGLMVALSRLLEELGLLERAFYEKAQAFRSILKVGRTQLQDAVPMTLGQEFGAYAVTLAEDHEALHQLSERLREINLGATAIGTGIAAPGGFAEAARRHLSELVGEPLVTAADLVEATTDVGVFLELSGSLKRTAMKLSKICNDLRLLSSGPQAGLHEINLPPRQAGSSIMPGKVNPVIPEAVNQVAFAVAGGDVTLTMAVEAGQLQLNAFEPVMAQVLFSNLKWMTAAMATLRKNCVEGITANTERLSEQMASSVGVITALIPQLGYAAAARLAREAVAARAPISDLIVAAGLMTREELTPLLSAERLTGDGR